MICMCFEGIMLEPCLLQPCFHVAGLCIRIQEPRFSETPGAQQKRDVKKQLASLAPPLIVVIILN